MPDSAWVALAIGVCSTVFWVGYFFGRQRAGNARLKRRVLDLERAYAKLANRDYVSRYPEDR